MARTALVWVVLALAAAACGAPSIGTPVGDGSEAGTDDAGVSDLALPSADDLGSADAAASPTDAAADAPRPTWLSAPGVECTGFTATIASVPREVDDPSACYGILHQADACGRMFAIGINTFGQVTACEAEALCEQMYVHESNACATDADCPAGQTCSCAHSSCSCGPSVPVPCSDNLITTDSGETTTNLADIHVACIRPYACGLGTGTCCTCYTRVCHDAACMTGPSVLPDPCGFGSSGAY